MSSRIGPFLNDASLWLMSLEHRFDPYFRDVFDDMFQRSLVEITQTLLRYSHPNHEKHLCEEIAIPDEDKITRQIVEEMFRFTEREYRGRIAERVGNTKTYGVVHAEFEVLDGLPVHLRKGIFATPQRFAAWIRFSGSGPFSPPDVSDAGIVSIGIKLTGVPGEKLLADEKATQDFLGISCPTFTSPNVVENLKLQRQLNAGTPTFYFLNPFDSHYLDLVMQALYARMNRSPFEVRYWSCVPYLLGEGQAMKYSVTPRASAKTKIPWNPPADWLRQAMTQTLLRREVEFDFSVQVQSDQCRMPIEDASIEWPESVSAFVPLARIRIPKQRFDWPEQFRFARALSYNPWHAIAEHRPLGNLNRARRVIYHELSRLRQSMNREPHVEPTGAEVFSEQAAV